MKIILTGSHFTPALAVAEQLKKNKNIEIVYVGRGNTMEGDRTSSVESRIFPSLGIKFIPLVTGRLQRSFTPYTISSLLKIPIGFIQSLYILLSEKPDVILSFGGYIGVPIVIVGWLFSIPIIIHEQTLVTGLSNKISSFFADKIAVSFENHQFSKKQTILTGNPIRDSILKLSKADTSKKRKVLTILIMGGNQGSHFINKTVEECLEKITKIADVIHISGDNKFEDFERLQRLQNDHYAVKKWLSEDYGEILSKSDLVISRAGINTLTELAYLGKPALVIPIPYLYQDEQNKNAKYFEKLGLVKILSQSQLSGKTLMEYIKLMLKNLEELKTKAKGANRVIIPDAAKRLTLETILLAKHD